VHPENTITFNVSDLRETSMAIAEFEEREFEAPLYNQLEVGSNLVWSPGQVFEEHIGIDRAIFVESPTFWRLIRRLGPPPGVFLHRYDWDVLDGIVLCIANGTTIHLM
jgi:hypothetical protein